VAALVGPAAAEANLVLAHLQAYEEKKFLVLKLSESFHTNIYNLITVVNGR
jgi:hypothetical protein